VWVGGSDFSSVDDGTVMEAPVMGSPAETVVERCCVGAGTGGGMVAVGEGCRNGGQSGVRSRASMGAFEKSMQDGKRSLWFFAKALVKTGRQFDPSEGFNSVALLGGCMTMDATVSRRVAPSNADCPVRSSKATAASAN